MLREGSRNKFLFWTYFIFVPYCRTIGLCAGDGPETL